MKRNLFLAVGIALLILALLWRVGWSANWTQRVPPGWTWEASFIGVLTNADPATGQLPAEDMTGVYQRSIKPASEANRPQSVTLEDHYLIRDINTGQTSYEYVYRAPVDPLSGAHLTPEYRGDVFLFPRNVEKKTYRLRYSYLKGIPVAFNREETIEGVDTYLFSYNGRAEYTESYAGTAQYPGVSVKPGQEIKCAGDQFALNVWVEPLTGEILKSQEGCLSGDYLYDVATGKQLAAVARWAGTTAGDDVLRRAQSIRDSRAQLLWMEWFLPGGLLVVGLLCIALHIARPRLRPFAGWNVNRSVARRWLLSQILGFGLILAAVLTYQYVNIRSAIYTEAQDNGKSVLRVLREMIAQNPALLRSASLDEVIDRSAASISGLARVSVINSALQIVADSETQSLGTRTDQTTLIQLLQEPGEQSFYFTRAGVNYFRVSETILGAADANGKPTAIGAVSIDLRLSTAESQVQAAFLQTLGLLGPLFLVFLFAQYRLVQWGILGPLRQVANAASRFGQGDMSARVQIVRADELGQVAQAFDRMASAVETAQLELSNLAAIVKSSDDAILSLALDGTILSWNAGAERLYGYSAAEAIGQPISLVNPDVQPEDMPKFAEFIRRGESLRHIEAVRVRKDGTSFDAALTISPIKDRMGQFNSASVIVHDITARKRAEQATLRRNAELSALNQIGRALSKLAEPYELLALIDTVIGQVLDNRNLYIALYDETNQSVSFPIYKVDNQRIVMTSFALPNSLTGYVIRTRAPLLLSHDLPAAAHALGLEPQGLVAKSYLGVPMLMGARVVGVIAIRDYEREDAYDEGHVDLLTTIASQAAIAFDNAGLFKEIDQLARTDALTGLANRRQLFEAGARELLRARRFSHALSALMLDIDQFKQVNDKHGHAAGDQILWMVARSLRAGVRDSDVVARYGGEEFVILLVETDLAGARILAERLREQVAKTVSVTDQGPLAVTISVGVTTALVGSDSVDTLLARVDGAVYAAKRAGGNQVTMV